MGKFLFYFFGSILRFPNSFIINKIKINVIPILLTKGCVGWWQTHWDASIKSGVQIWANHVYEFGILGDV